MSINKKWSVPMAILLALTLLVSACGGGNETNTQQPNSSSSNSSSKSGSTDKASTDKTAAKEKLTIEATYMQSQSLPPGEHPITTFIEEKFNIDYTVTTYPSADEYSNLLNVRVASDNPPDLMYLTKDQLREYHKSGLLLDLTPYLDQLSNVPDFLGTKDPFLTATFDGKVEAVPRLRGIPAKTFWLRKDWLEKVNMQVPTTLDELYAVAKAFTDNDPDGNGKKDTYGITGVGNMESFLPVFGAYGAGLPGTFYLEDGKLVNAFYDEGSQQALDYIKKLLSDGLIEPDFMSNTNENQSLEKAYQGKAGIIYTHWATITKTENQKQILAVNPSATWVQGSNITGPGGDFNTTYDIGGDSGFLALPKKLEKNPEKIERVLELVNFLATTEGSNLVMYGLEGKHYTITDGRVVPTPLLDEEGGSFVVHQLLGRKEPEYLYTKFPNDIGHVDYANSLPRLETLNGFIVRPDNYNNADALRYANEEYVKFIYGRRPLSEYNDFLNTLENTFNYKLMLDKAEKDLKENGVLK
jgi:putative aldouronate transport system substrate-binding protein